MCGTAAVQASQIAPKASAPAGGCHSAPIQAPEKPSVPEQTTQKTPPAQTSTAVADAAGGAEQIGKDPNKDSPKAPPADQKPPTDVAGDEGPGQLPTQTDVGGKDGPGQKPPTDVAGDEGPAQKPDQTDVAGDEGPAQKPADPKPEPKAEEPTEVADAAGGAPTQKPDQKGPTELRDVKLTNLDSKTQIKFERPGLSVELWGDPHVIIKGAKDELKFDVGDGPVSHTFEDGTKVEWDTYLEGQKREHQIRNFSVTLPDGSEVGGNTSDKVNSIFENVLTKSQLEELARFLYANRGKMAEPFKNAAANAADDAKVNAVMGVEADAPPTEQAA